MKIDTYQPGNEEAIVSLWNRCLYKGQITMEMFERKVLLDPTFAPEGCFVARSQSHLIGFILSIIRRFPLFYQGLEEDKGWITAFFRPGRI